MRADHFRKGFAALALFTVVSTTHAQQAEKPDAPRALKAEDLAGAYEIVAGEKFGVAEPADRIKGSTVRFTEDRVVVMDKDSKEVYGASYALESAEAASGEAASGAVAAKIRMTSKLADAENQVALGLVDKDGDKVRLVYALPGVEAPKEFKTKAKQLLFVLKKKVD